MDKAKIISELNKIYPGKTVICIPEVDPTEILCEVDPSSLHPGYSAAISVIDKSISHVHKITTEVYEVVRGEMTLYINSVPHLLKQGDKFTILPGEKHWALGKETWLKATSHPGWTPDDHIFG